jgi:hypothetical protein
MIKYSFEKRKKNTCYENDLNDQGHDSIGAQASKDFLKI